MIPLIVFGAIIAAPVLLALIFRVQAAYVFMSICAGYFLQFALSDDVDLAFATVIQGSDSVVVARLVLLALPLVLTLFLLRKTIGRSAIFQIIPLVFSGMFLAVLVLPLAPPGFADSVYNAQFGGNIKRSQDLVMTAAVVSNIVLTWMLFKHKNPHGKHR